MEVQPPFLRPALTEAQLEAKVLDNGIQNDRHSTRVSGFWIQRFGVEHDFDTQPKMLLCFQG